MHPGNQWRHRGPEFNKERVLGKKLLLSLFVLVRGDLKRLPEGRSENSP